MPMQAARIHEPHHVQMTEVDVPVPQPHELRIQVHRTGICGTDLHIFEGAYEASYPLVPGHEFSGVVAEVGSAVRRFAPGDRVTADPNVPCHNCHACQRSRHNQCANLAATGVTRDGAFAECVVAPEGNVYEIGSLSFAAAAMIEPLACVVWGLKRVQVQPGDDMLIFGAGPMGCLMAQAARSSGAARVVMCDPVAWRLDLARGLGVTETLAPEEVQDYVARHAPSGFDVVADATGLPDVIERLPSHARPRGKVWLFGVCPPGVTVPLSPYEVFRKDLAIIGSFALDRTFHESLAMVHGGAVRVEPLISHREPLDRFPRALEIAQSDPQRMKVQVGAS